MRFSASIELIMQFATYEAMAARFREVEPEHMLMALLKLPELPTEGAEKLARDPSAGKQVTEDVSAVCKELSRRSIDCKNARHELRTEMGRGNSPSHNGVIHRSMASRQIFDVAVRLADGAGKESVTAEYLFEALMIAPTQVIEHVLGNAVGAKLEQSRETSLLRKHGRDLTRMAADGDLHPDEERTTEGKALLNVLSQPGRKSVLLITDSDSAPMQTVIRAAQIITFKDSYPETMKGKRIYDVTRLKPSGKLKTGQIDMFDKLYAEAVSLEDAILFVPTIEFTGEDGASDEWAEHLHSILAGGSVQCICQVKPRTYENCIKRDFTWKQLTHALWIRDEIKDEIPREL